jgi:hypothetical protein
MVLAGPSPGLPDPRRAGEPVPEEPPLLSVKQLNPAYKDQKEDIGNAAQPGKASEGLGEKKSGSESARGAEEGKTKGSSLDEFVPTEKIPADQAVDFPADI